VEAFQKGFRTRVIFLATERIYRAICQAVRIFFDAPNAGLDDLPSNQSTEFHPGLVVFRLTAESPEFLAKLDKGVAGGVSRPSDGVGRHRTPTGC
jgi:hypothetical protein